METITSRWKLLLHDGNYYFTMETITIYTFSLAHGKVCPQGDVELSDLETIWSDGDISFSGQ